MSERLYTSIGLMSGTSCDGIDAALLRTDGRMRIETGENVFLPFHPQLRMRLRDGMALARQSMDLARKDLVALEEALTLAHADAVAALLADAGLAAAAIDVIGFHGQTLFHDPQRGVSWQLGDGPLLGRMTGIDVVGDFRAADIEAGGEGAPLAPGYHQALLLGDEDSALPAVILNIGGVSNISYVGQETLIACDCGPGNALIDDWMQAMTGNPMDIDGALARSGTVHREIIDSLLDHPWFDRPPPKSLDRDAFPLAAVRGLSASDGAATLMAFTIEAIALAFTHLPRAARHAYVTGGGRHNRAMTEGLAARLGIPVAPVEMLGWQGDFIEAEAFAWLAVRHLEGLPMSWPETTGVSAPVCGGRLHAARGG